MDLFKDWIASITSKKNYLFAEGDVEQLEKEYNAFMVNRALSQHVGGIFQANEMNLNSHLDPKLQYDYLFYSLEQKGLYSKWAKGEKQEEIALIMEVYNVSRKVAEEYHCLMTPEDINKLKEYTFKGGRVKGK